MRARKFAISITSLVIAASSLVVLAPAAEASGCSGGASKTSNSTTAWSNSSGCSAQARIDRYVSGVVYPYYGYWEPVGYSSYIYKSTGTNSGNAWRLGPTAWMWF